MTKVVDELTAGYYKLRLTKGGPEVAVELIFGPPEDPETGEVLDRAPRWWVKVNGRYSRRVGIYQATNATAITKVAYDKMLAVADFAKGTGLPEDHPEEAIDLTEVPSLF